jgi:hypothetical protein
MQTDRTNAAVHQIDREADRVGDAFVERPHDACRQRRAVRQYRLKLGLLNRSASLRINPAAILDDYLMAVWTDRNGSGAAARPVTATTLIGSAATNPAVGERLTIKYRHADAISPRLSHRGL